MKPRNVIALLVLLIMASAFAGPINVLSGPRYSPSGGVTELSDWNDRKGGAGVVWYHNFDSVNEVNAFRWKGSPCGGNDPTSSCTGSAQVTWDSGDGFAGGGSLKMVNTAGTSEPAGWWRPFSPIVGGTTTGNGRGAGQNDPGAGTITPRSWNPGNVNEMSNHQVGWYGHADYQDSDFDGGEFWISWRTKVSASRWDDVTQNGSGETNADFDGKMAFITENDRTPPSELLFRLTSDELFNIYTGFGSPGPLEFMFDPQDYSTGSPPADLTFQPGGAYDTTCRLGNRDAAHCWAWSTDEWITWLVHVTPGHVTQDAFGAADWGVAIYAAREGETSYTTIYDKADYQLFFNGGSQGYNAFQASVFHNGQPMPLDFTVWYTQIIFSKAFIPCPQAANDERFFEQLVRVA